MRAPGGFVPVLVVVSGGFGLGLSAMQGFVVPLRAHELGASPVEIGVLVAAGALVQALTSIPLGRLTDRIGARHGFAMGAAGVVVASCFGWLATDLRGLFAAHVVFGVTRGWGWIATQSYMTGYGDAQQLLRRSGRFAFVSGVAGLAGPATIGVAAENASFAVGFLIIGAVAGAFVGVAMCLPDQELVRPATSTMADGAAEAAGLLRLTGVASGLLLSAVDLWIHKVWTAFVPIVLLEGGMAAGIIGTVVSAKALGAMFGSLATPWTARTRWPRAAVGGVLLTIASGALAVSGVLTVAPAVHVLAFVVGVAGGVTTPLSIASVGEAAGSRRTTALGYRATTNQISATVAPVAMGKLMVVAAAPLAFVLAAIVAGGALLLGFAGPLRWPEVRSDRGSL